MKLPLRKQTSFNSPLRVDILDFDGIVIAQSLTPDNADVIIKMFSRVSHPTIHIDFYEWLNSLTPYDRAFMSKYAELKDGKAIAMFAWSRARETLRDLLHKAN
jgi:methylaspartate ammonia-lyase